MQESLFPLLTFLSLSLSLSLSVSVDWVQTCQSTEDRLTQQRPLFFSSSSIPSSSDLISVHVDPSKRYQKILGFGGALTQSSATVYKTLTKDLKKEVIDAYYSESGLKYTTGRLPIHSCDFSVDVYTFDDVADDVNLDYFDTAVTYDQNLSLPLIHDALASNPNLLLFGSPWSPPAWMKDNNDMLYGGSLLDQYRPSWASYFSKWITAYKNQNVPIWGVTVQNEPEASQTWESCLYTASEMSEFVGGYLGPVLQQDHPDVKIFGFDHNKDHISDWADTLLSESSPSSRYIDGIAFHWYSGSCFANVAAVYGKYPETILLPSEACYELTVLEDDASDEAWLVNGTWSKGEGYGYDIIGDLESGSAGWTDWNILLDSTGGPNHVDNFCDAAIIASEDGLNVYYHPQYYYLGHFSRYLPPGAERVYHEVYSAADVQSTYEDCQWPYGGCDESTLHVTSWSVEDLEHDIVVIVMNCGGEDKMMNLTIDGVDGELINTVPAHSIQTYLI